MTREIKKKENKNNCKRERTTLHAKGPLIQTVECASGQILQDATKVANIISSKINYHLNTNKTCTKACRVAPTLSRLMAQFWKKEFGINNLHYDACYASYAIRQLITSEKIEIADNLSLKIQNKKGFRGSLTLFASDGIPAPTASSNYNKAYIYINLSEEKAYKNKENKSGFQNQVIEPKGIHPEPCRFKAFSKERVLVQLQLHKINSKFRKIALNVSLFFFRIFIAIVAIPFSVIFNPLNKIMLKDGVKK